MEILEKRLEKAPGLVLLFAIAAVLLLEEKSEISAGFRVFLVAWSLYALSSVLDRIVFDVLYGPPPRGKKPRLRKFLPGYAGLEEKRGRAKTGLELEYVAGLYNRAKQYVLEEDKERVKTGQEKIWEETIEPFLFWSKFSRSFVLPCLVIVFAAYFATYLPKSSSSLLLPVLCWLSGLGFGADFARAREKLEILFTYPAIPLIICIVSFFVYVFLRIFHMHKLYAQAANRRNPIPSPSI